MDFLKQAAGGVSSTLNQTSRANGESGVREFSRVPEWLKTAGETVGFVGQTAGNLVGDLSAPLAPLAGAAAKLL